MTSTKVTAPTIRPEAVTTHKEDRQQSHPTSSTESLAFQQIVSWYAGGPRPHPTILHAASTYGISDRKPTSPQDRVRALALAAFATEEIIAAVPELNPVDIVDIIADIPDTAYGIVRAHLEGYTPVEIALRIDASRPTVYYWLDKLNLKPHKRSRDELTARQRTQVVRAYEAGEPMANIARRFDVSYDQVRYAIKKSAA